MANTVILLSIGLVTGIFSGFFGIGGGIVLIPLLLFIMKYPPQVASGTSLVALLLPVGLLGAISYFRAGAIDASHIRSGLLISSGIFFGTYFGSRLGMLISPNNLRVGFGVLLLAVSIKMLCFGEHI